MRPVTRRALLALFGIGLLALGWASASAAPGSYHEDERLGYKVRAPKDWTSIPMAVDEQWMAAKFLSDKAHFYREEASGFTYDHKPEMTVIAFIADVVKKRGIQAGETDDGFLIQIKNPYKNYEDYLRRTYSGGGWFISEDEEGELDGIPVRKLEIKVEKLTRSGPKRIVTWIFHTEEVDFAVQFEVLEGAYRKLKGEMRSCLKSFKRIPRTKGSLAPTTTGGPSLAKDEDEMSSEERELHRRQTEKRHHEKAVERLPEGWKAKEVGRFLVLNHADEKYAKKVVAQAEAVWTWLDKTFSWIGEGEYVRRPILRICKDGDEERAFRSGDWFGMGLEIVTHKDSGSGAMSSEFEYVNKRVLAIWFNHHDRDLYSALPGWLDRGLSVALGSARFKGSRIEFRVDEWAKDQLRVAAKEGKRTKVQDLMKMSGSDFWSEWHRGDEAAALVRFLLEVKGKKEKKILHTYLRHLDELVEEEKKAQEEKAKADSGTSEYKEPETEEEEEERFRKRREGWKEKENDLLEKVFERTFGDWSDKDWRRFEDKFRKTTD